MHCYKYAHDMYCQVDIGLSYNMNMMKGIENIGVVKWMNINEHWYSNMLGNC
jgi:hypothetical protein